MERLADTPGTAALAAQFCILTASRPGNLFNAMWEEINLETALWQIPATKYKTGKPHQVPLSNAAMKVLGECPRMEGNDHVFISPMKAGAALSAMSVIALFRRMGVAETLHGTARSTFSDWAHNETDTSHEVIEMALGHTQSGVVRAYWRKYPVDKIRVLLEAWAKRCTQVMAAVAAE